ncbi:MAG: ABC transporter substrate-binding protein [Deltaproteobacteria bacterium]|nr:ABC transporter substrate-binding protein [Deltaproteobacteria bacterium]
MKGLLRRLILGVLVLLMIGVWAAAPVLAEPVVKEWKVPFLIFLTGPYGGFGKQIQWASDQAAKEINDAGGIAGRPIDIRYHDTALDPAKAAAEMSKVVKNSLLIFGPIAATTTKAAMPMVIREKAFAMAIACGTDVSLEFQPYTVHFLGQYDEFIPPPIQGWAKRNPEMKSVVQLIWPLDPTWVDIANAQRRALEAIGVEVLPDVELSEGVDFSSAVIKAMAKKPDGYTIIVGPVEAAKIVKELDKRGMKDKGKIVIFITAYDPALFDVGKGYLDGVYHWSGFDWTADNPRWQNLYQLYQDAHSGITAPTIGVPLFYDMVYLAKAAIENTGVTGDPAKLAEERDKIRDYCRNVKDFPGVQYTFSIVDGIAKMPGFLFVIEEDKKGMLKLVESYPAE